MNKKILIVLVLLLMFSFANKSFASLTFTSNAIIGTSASSIDLGSSNDLFLQTSGGKVGIGTTSPSSALDIREGTDRVVSFQTFLDTAGFIFMNDANDNYVPASIDATNLFLNAHTTGKVGIGTTNPGAVLDVYGTIRGSAYGAPVIASGTGIQMFYNSVTAAGRIVSVDSSTATYKKLEFWGNPINFLIGSSEKARITSSGNLGIGTTNPGSKLSVVGLSVYADNTAALAGGLVAGDMYMASTGVLMITY